MLDKEGTLHIETTWFLEKNSNKIILDHNTNHIVIKNTYQGSRIGVDVSHIDKENWITTTTLYTEVLPYVDDSISQFVITILKENLEHGDMIHLSYKSRSNSTPSKIIELLPVSLDNIELSKEDFFMDLEELISIDCNWFYIETQNMEKNILIVILYRLHTT